MKVHPKLALNSAMSPLCCWSYRNKGCRSTGVVFLCGFRELPRPWRLEKGGNNRKVLRGMEASRSYCVKL